MAADRGVPLTVTGAGSLFGLHLTAGPVRTFRDTWAEDQELALAVYLGLINEGVLTDPRGAGCLSTVTTAEDLDRRGGRLRPGPRPPGLRTDNEGNHGGVGSGCRSSGARRTHAVALRPEDSPATRLEGQQPKASERGSGRQSSAS